MPASNQGIPIALPQAEIVYMQQTNENLRRDYDTAYLRNAFLEFTKDVVIAKSIENSVDNRISKKLPDQIDNYLDKRNEKLFTLVPQFLNQNTTMNDILKNHALNLNKQLNENCSEILARICKEPEYHDLRQAYIRSIDVMFSEQMDSHNKLFKSNLNENMKIIKLLEKDMKTIKLHNNILSISLIGVASTLAYSLFKK